MTPPETGRYRGPGEHDRSRRAKKPAPNELKRQETTLRLVGDIPPELWNRFGTRVLPKLRAGEDLSVRIDSSVLINAGSFENLQRELRQALEDLGLTDHLRIES